MPENQLAYLIIVIFVFAGLLAIRRRRDSVIHHARSLVIFGLTVWGTAWLLTTRQHVQQGTALGIGLFAGVLILQLIRPRGRHIPAAERRRAIARYELRTGKKYNPKKHDLDHEIPFSKGGSSTSDNLNVMDRGKNRSKKARSAWWDPFG